MYDTTNEISACRVRVYMCTNILVSLNVVYVANVNWCDSESNHFACAQNAFHLFSSSFSRFMGISVVFPGIICSMFSLYV